MPPSRVPYGGELDAMAEHETPHSRGKRMMRESGYHADEAQDKALIHDMVKPKALKRKSGGGVMGAASKHRPDKRSRGGHTVVNVIAGGAGAGGGQDAMQKVQMAHKIGVQQGLKAGAQLGARAAMSHGAGPGGPPMAPPPGGGAPGMPPGDAPGMPPMAKRGGGIQARAKGGGVDAGGEPPVTMRSDKYSGVDGAHMPPFPKEDQTIPVRAHERRRSGGGVDCG